MKDVTGANDHYTPTPRPFIATKGLTTTSRYTWTMTVIWRLWRIATADLRISDDTNQKHDNATRHTTAATVDPLTDTSYTDRSRSALVVITPNSPQCIHR